MVFLLPELSPSPGVPGLFCLLSPCLAGPEPASVDRASREHYPFFWICFLPDGGEGCGERDIRGVGRGLTTTLSPNSLLALHEPKKGNLWIWVGKKGKRNRPFPPISWGERSKRTPKAGGATSPAPPFFIHPLHSAPSKQGSPHPRQKNQAAPSALFLFSDMGLPPKLASN